MEQLKKMIKSKMSRSTIIIAVVVFAVICGIGYIIPDKKRSRANCRKQRL